MTYWLCIEKHRDDCHKPSCIVRPCKLSYDEVVAAIKHSVIQLQPCIKNKDDAETIDQFKIKLAADGVQIDFELYDEFDDFIQRKCIKSKLVDEHTGKALFEYAKC